MNGLVEVVDAGIGNSIQDAGRFGFRHMGIAVSGCLDEMLARCANALVGNSPDCACIEIRAVGPKLAVRKGKVRLALVGDVSAIVIRIDGSETEIQPWQTVLLGPQDEVQIGFLAGGTAYLAVSGGFSSPLQLGSRSTYQRAEIGSPMAVGLLLPCIAQPLVDDHVFTADPWRHEDGAIRVMLGPQDDHFKPEALSDLCNHNYQVTAQSDRMGVRLEGAALMHVTPAAADIVSDGVAPGVIQVPGNGQPIILLADCQTVGGYPKIATVISADLPRLGQVKPGQAVRFQLVDAEQARQALRRRETDWKWWVYGIRNAMAGSTNLDLRAGWPVLDC